MVIGLYRTISARRKRQLALVFLLMLLGAVSEIVTLGTVVPFIAVMMDPNALSNFPFVERLFPGLKDVDSAKLRLYVALAFSEAAISAGVIRLILTWSTYAVVHRLGNDIATRAYSNILHQPYAYHLKTNSSTVIASFSNIQLLIQDVIFPAIKGTVSIVLALCILITLVVITPSAALWAVIGFGIVFGGTRLLTGQILHRCSATIARMQSKRLQAVLEGIGSIRDIIIDRTQGVFVSRFQDYDRRFQSAYATKQTVSRTPRFVVEGLGIAVIAFIALYLTSQPGGAIAALPLLGALALGAQRLLPLIQETYEAWAHVAAGRDITKQVLDILKLPAADSTRKKAPADGTGFDRDIVFDDVSFRYDDTRDPVLSSLSFMIPKGSIVGLIGETGSGKSTLADLLLGLLRPTSGSILVDGQRLDRERLRSWHARIAHVPQAIYLQDASIEQNIALGVEPHDIDIDRVRAVVRLAKLDTFIETLPQGYQTEVGDRGARLSGGQIQRIGIARALYKNPEILVFDEATSALDTDTETDVMEALRGVSRTKTVIIIAHRLSTLGFCDTILKLQNGRIVEKQTITPLQQGLATAS